jgi:hypothetical protein
MAKAKKATAKQLAAYENTPADKAQHDKGVKEGSSKDKKQDNAGALKMAKKARKAKK